MRWIVLGVLTGWTGIVALAWWLADRRIEICVWRASERGCDIAATAVRDNVLVWGAMVPLGAFVLLLVLGLVRTERLKLPKAAPPSASRDIRPRQ